MILTFTPRQDNDAVCLDVYVCLFPECEKVGLILEILVSTYLILWGDYVSDYFLVGTSNFLETTLVVWHLFRGNKSGT